MSATQKYTKKPVTVETMTWDGTAKDAIRVINWIHSHGGSATYACATDECTGTSEGHVIDIQTLEGKHDASPGDIVIKGVKDEFYPCKPDIFALTYDGPVES